MSKLYLGSEPVVPIHTIVQESTIVFEHTYDPTENPAATVASITGRLADYVLVTTFEALDGYVRETLYNNLESVKTSVNSLRETKQDVLVFDGTYNAGTNKAATVQTVLNKIAEVVANAPESFNTLKEMSDWINAHSDSAASMNSDIQANATSISALQQAFEEHAQEGQDMPTLQDLLGTEPIGKYTSLYYDGEKFVEMPLTLENASWETIAEISEAGKASEYFSVGDEKNVELATGEQITLVILGFDQDDLYDGTGTAGITFGMKNLLATKYPIHNGDNIWVYTDMYVSTLPTLFSHLPSDLQSVIKTVSKRARLSSTYGTSKYEHHLFLFSPAEVGISGANDTYGGLYTYYEVDSVIKRQKELSNGDGEASVWWLRWTPQSPSSGSYYYAVSTDGTVKTLPTKNEYGICFGFCI